MDIPTLLSTIAGFGSFAVAAVLVMSYAYQAKTYKKQNEIDQHQVTLESARLVLDLDARLKTDEANMLMAAVTNDKMGAELLSEKYNKIFHTYINDLVIICKFYQEGLITRMHMRNFFYAPIMMFDDNDWVHDYLDKYRGGYTFLYSCIVEIRKEFPRHTDPFEQQKTLFDHTARNGTLVSGGKNSTP